MNNQMRSIRSSLTCQSPSDSIQFFKIVSAPTARFSIRSVKPSNNIAMGRQLNITLEYTTTHLKGQARPGNMSKSNETTTLETSQFYI